MSGIKNEAYEVELTDCDVDKDQINEISRNSATESTLELSSRTESIEPHASKQMFKSRLEQKVIENRDTISTILVWVLNLLVVGYFAYATYFFIDTEFVDFEDAINETKYVKNDYFGIIVRQSDETGNSTEELEETRCRGNCGWQWCDGYGMLILLFFFLYLGLFYFKIFKPYFGKTIDTNCLQPIGKMVGGFMKVKLIRYGIIVAVIAAIITYTVIDTGGAPERLQSMSGIVLLFLFGYAFSKNRQNINWRTVLIGALCQFLLGIICIRWDVGRLIFACLGDKVTTFLNFSIIGSNFVFGHLLVYTEAVFAFSVLPVIFFFSFCISMLYYLGTMQWVVMKLGWVLSSLLGTTVCESVNAAGNIFLGMSEAPLLIKPYLKDLTRSEMHSIMTSGFATVSGTVLAAYVSFGANSAHLVTSSVMAAPATLCFSKLFYPETEKSKTTADNIEMEKSTDSSMLDAASNGAGVAVSIILGIIANLVAFVSFIAFLNAVVNYFGFMVGADDLTFEWIFARIFMPLSWVLGIPWSECIYVGELIATKTIVNEFVAYEKLGVFKRAELISPRSAAIATYAVCGFANPSSLGIMIGAISALAPEKRGVITEVAFRAFVGGCCVCFITASIAGLLMNDEMLDSI